MFVLLLLACRVRLVEPHARLLEPPSRASMWRLGFPTPRDPDDNQVRLLMRRPQKFGCKAEKIFEHTLRVRFGKKHLAIVVQQKLKN